MGAVHIFIALDPMGDMAKGPCGFLRHVLTAPEKFTVWKDVIFYIFLHWHSEILATFETDPCDRCVKFGCFQTLWETSKTTNSLHKSSHIRAAICIIHSHICISNNV